MEFYPTLYTLHIIFAGIWLINLVSDSFLKGVISKNKHKSGERKFISLYLTFVNLFGMIGSTGILISGILITAMNPGYGFFQMSGNHWLAAKQIIMVVILLIIFVFVIPQAKKIRISLGKDLETSEGVSEEGYRLLTKLFKINTAINLLVLINFLFAITHRYLG